LREAFQETGIPFFCRLAEYCKDALFRFFQVPSGQVTEEFVEAGDVQSQLTKLFGSPLNESGTLPRWTVQRRKNTKDRLSSYFLQQAE